MNCHPVHRKEASDPHLAPIQPPHLKTIRHTILHTVGFQGRTRTAEGWKRKREYETRPSFTKMPSALAPFSILWPKFNSKGAERLHCLHSEFSASSFSHNSFSREREKNCLEDLVEKSCELKCKMHGHFVLLIEGSESASPKLSVS